MAYDLQHRYTTYCRMDFKYSLKTS